MTLQEYKKHIDELVKDGFGDMEVYYSSDEEGNYYEKIFYEPSVQKLDGIGEVIVVN